MSQVAIREERTSIQSVAFGREAGGGNLAPQNLGDIVRFAEVMARADIAIPKHLRDNPGACLAVCMQAFKWEMDPFSVAQKSYKVGDQMAYEAQLIAAVINTRAGLKRRPSIEYEGDGADRVCIVTFDAADGSTHVYRSPRFAAITTKNSPLWKSDPDQQLGYYSIRAGARRHFPEVILGVYDRDEIEGVRDVTPAPVQSGFAARIKAPRVEQISSGAAEGFRRDHINEELSVSQRSAVESSATIDENSAEDVPEMSAEASVGSSDQSLADADSLNDEPEASEPEHEERSSDLFVCNLLAEAAQKFLEIAGGDLNGRDKQTTIADAVSVWKREVPEEHHPALKKVVDRANAVITGKSTLAAAVALIAAEIGAKEDDVRPAVRR